MRRTFTQLTQDERRTLAQLLQKKTPKTQIAEILGRDRSTIHRELKRNWWHDAEIPEADGYWHTTAQTLATGRRTRQRKLVRLPKLRAAVIDRLKEGWSPEQIAGRLKIEPRSPSGSATRPSINMFIPMRVSHWNWRDTFQSAVGDANPAMPESHEIVSFHWKPAFTGGQKRSTTVFSSAIGKEI